MKISQVALSKLLPYPFNNKKHSATQISSIVSSIKEFGFVQPIVTDKDYVIIIGHARLEASKAIGLTEVPVVIMDNLTDHQTKRLRLLDNRLSDLGEYDLDNIKIELEALGDDDLYDLFKDLDLEDDDGSGTGEEDAKISLQKKFGVPPFSILDARQGYWTDRKRLWRELITDDGDSREKTLYKPEGTEFAEKMLKAWEQGNGVSIFDPVLAEIIVNWFCPPGGSVLDTFAGGASGFVYSYLGHPFTGIELRKEQAKINNARLEAYDLTHGRYINDDGQNVLNHVEENSQDLLFSCPPYFDLEVYSDDPKDASNQKDYESFRKILENAFTGGAKALKNNRFAVVVMSNIRDDKWFYRDICGDIKAIMEKNGLHLYNEIIFINSIGGAPMRANNTMKNRKVVRTHQEVLVFAKGSSMEGFIEQNGFDPVPYRQSIQFHEDVLVFFKGNPKDIKKDFPEVDLTQAPGMDEALTADDPQ